MVGITHSGVSAVRAWPVLVLRGVFAPVTGVLGVLRADAGADVAAFRGVCGSLLEVGAGNALLRYPYSFLYTRGGHGGRDVIVGKLSRFFNLQKSVYCV